MKCTDFLPVCLFQVTWFDWKSIVVIYSHISICNFSLSLYIWHILYSKAALSCTYTYGKKCYFPSIGFQYHSAFCMAVIVVCPHPVESLVLIVVGLFYASSFFLSRSTYILASMINKWEGQEERRDAITLNGTEVLGMTD